MIKKDITYWVDTADKVIEVANNMCDGFHDNRIEMDDFQKEYLKIVISAAIFDAYHQGVNDTMPDSFIEKLEKL